MIGKRIAMVTRATGGGVKATVSGMRRALSSEGHYPELVILRGLSIPYMMCSDLTNIRRLEDFDNVLYMDSIAWPSHLFTRGPKNGLFLHGFVDLELINAAKHESLRPRLGALALLAYRKVCDSIAGKLDFSICRSLTSRETNKVRGTCVILPQFILEEDIPFYQAFSRHRGDAENPDRTVRIASYLSLARSPRLLSAKHLLTIAERLTRLVKTRCEFTVVDPVNSIRSSYSIGPGYLRVLRYLSRTEFLILLNSSDLYLERCTDEELGISSLEAGLLGTPVAKMTLPRFESRQDYCDGDLMSAPSIEGLTKTVAEYVNRVEDYKPYYKRGIGNFIRSKRLWSQVKKPLMQELDGDQA